MPMRIMGLHETSVPKHFTRRMSAQVRYGTYTVEQITRHESMRANLNAGRSLMAEEKPASHEDKLALTEYCIINNPEDLRSAFESGTLPEVYDLMRDIENRAYSPSGRFLGMYDPENPKTEYWHFDDLITSRYRAGLRILELGPGPTLCAITHAKYHPDHFITTVEANAMNIRSLYQDLDRLGYVTNPLPNLRVLIGDIRHMPPPEDFTAGLLIANWVFWHQNVEGDVSRPRDEDKEMFAAFLKWSNPDAALRLCPPLSKTALGLHIADVMRRPENSGRKLFFGIK